MSKEVAIEVKGISKKYLIGSHNEDRLRYAFGSIFKKQQKEEVWALKDVSFTINKGEVVGIIGNNGAGKSTLLKILSKITRPTKGEVKMYGRVASLLEVGTGFHHELTGRENIFLNGSLLGLTRQEIKAKLDEIIAFSGIDRFIDTPVKHYSSGMYVRLAFAVAAHLEPEILLIDEVLAVGDYEFQQKCLGKMDDVARSGRTVVIVSHNLSHIKSNTNSAILLQNGQVVTKGNTPEVIKQYVNKVTVSAIKKEEQKSCFFEAAKLLNKQYQVQNIFSNEESILLELDINCSGINPDMEISISVLSSDGVRVFTLQENLIVFRDEKMKDQKVTLLFEANFIFPGKYTWHLCILENNVRNYDLYDSILPFEVFDNNPIHNRYKDKGSIGLVYPKFQVVNSQSI